MHSPFTVCHCIQIDMKICFHVCFSLSAVCTRRTFCLMVKKEWINRNKSEYHSKMLREKRVNKKKRHRKMSQSIIRGENQSREHLPFFWAGHRLWSCFSVGCILSILSTLSRSICPCNQSYTHLKYQTTKCSFTRYMDHFSEEIFLNMIWIPYRQIQAMSSEKHSNNNRNR